jgi:PKD repeat protein
LTAVLRTAGVELAQDSVLVQVQINPNARRVVLTASPRSGPAPLSVKLRAAATGPMVDYAWDAEGDGVVDSSGATLSDVTIHYQTPGVYVPRVTVRDAHGATVSDETPILVVAQSSLLALLDGKWRAFKDALRVGNVPAALDLVAESRRPYYQQIFQNLTVPLAQIDQVLGDVRFVQIRGNTVEYEMLRTDERGRLSYLVRFVVDTDGIWRLKDL